jgi:hypothetical protein
VDDKPPGDLLRHRRVSHQLLPSLCPRPKHNPSALGIKVHGSVVLEGQVVGGKLAEIDQPLGNTIGERRPEFLHEVQGQGRLPDRKAWRNPT